ncbi:MAG TPA: 3-dehydroquinate synthase [Flavobacteriia bacterium]|nr:3-dehydroquinate synthase [Flavobacteriia bacterium]
MKTISAGSYAIFFEEKKYKSLENYLKSDTFTTVFILVDSNTKKYCLPLFLSKIPDFLDYQIIEFPAGENFKNIDTCQFVWNQLTLLKADRKSLVFHLGGGMLTDLGGFTAATFKRGIRFVNFPTTLLGMVDASIGGKTGIDFQNLKNQIGLFANPQHLIVDFSYLKTLPKRELYSGFAEIIKYGLSYDIEFWKSLNQHIPYKEEDLKQWIYQSINIKNAIVLQDPNEKGIRKILNYGHTIGHAIESYFLESKDKKDLLHGEAVAAGLLMETYISVKLFNVKECDLNQLEKLLFSYFDKVDFSETDYPYFLQWMQHDKKNIKGEVLFTLLDRLGEAKWNIKVPDTLILEAFDYYRNLKNC